MQARLRLRRSTSALQKNGNYVHMTPTCYHLTPFSSQLMDIFLSRHPDKNKNPGAEDMFIKITKSYEVCLFYHH